MPGALRCQGGLIPHASRAGQSSRALEDAAWLAASQAYCLLHPTYEEVLTEENKYLCLPLPCLAIICPKSCSVTCTQNRCSLQLSQPRAQGCQDPVRCPRTFALSCPAGSGMLEQPWAGRTLPRSLGAAGPFLPADPSITLRHRVPPTAQPLCSAAVPPPLNSLPSLVGS